MITDERIDRLTRPGCWLWTGLTNDSGYGLISIFGKHNLYVHRVMYQIFKGPIPDDLEILHSCHTRNCCAPDHLSADTHVENMRQVGVRRWDVTPKACIRNHPWPEFLSVGERKDGRRYRFCTKCQRLAEQRYKARKPYQRKPKRTTCRNNHPRTPENVYQRPDGVRECRPCKQINKQRELARKRQRTAERQTVS